MQKRREVIKKIGIGTAWTTPIVQSIVLPAHAQTSSTTTTEAPTTTTTTTASPSVTYSIDSATFSVFEVASGQTQVDSSAFSGSVSASDGSIPTGAEIQLEITMSPGGQTAGLSGFSVQSDGSISYMFGDQQFVATGNTSATGVFSFVDTATYGSSTFTATDTDLSV